jgi:predicted dehydrogenase
MEITSMSFEAPADSASSGLELLAVGHTRSKIAAGLQTRLPDTLLRILLLDGIVTRLTGWGILATGHIASVFARDLALLSSEARLVAVGSRSLERAMAFAADHGISRAYDSYVELAGDPDVDVVYVASPHHDHFASAKLCLEAGKSVLVEKPMTVNPADTAELINRARDRGLFLMEALWTRTNPLIRKAAALAASGDLGDIRHVSADFGFAFRGPGTHRLLDPALAGGAILDAGVYPLHAVNLFLGEPTDLFGFGNHAATGVDSHAAALLTYPATDERSAATATVICSLDADLPTGLQVYGSFGRIMINDFFIRPKEMLVYRGHHRDVAPEVLVTQWPGGGYTFQAQEVMRCLRAGELESPMVPWRDSLAVARTLALWRAVVGDAVAQQDDSPQEESQWSG